MNLRKKSEEIVQAQEKLLKKLERSEERKILLGATRVYVSFKQSKGGKHKENATVVD